jgi:hypothetical protein
MRPHYRLKASPSATAVLAEEVPTCAAVVDFNASGSARKTQRALTADLPLLLRFAVVRLSPAATHASLRPPASSRSHGWLRSQPGYALVDRSACCRELPVFESSELADPGSD